MGNSHLGRVKFLSQFLILRFKFFNSLVLFLSTGEDVTFTC